MSFILKMSAGFHMCANIANRKCANYLYFIYICKGIDLYKKFWQLYLMNSARH